MTQAWWTAFWPHLKNPPALHKVLVAEDDRPKPRQSWQEMKAALVLALGGPTKS